TRRTACRHPSASTADRGPAHRARTRRRTAHRESRAWAPMVPHTSPGAAPRARGSSRRTARRARAKHREWRGAWCGTPLADGARWDRGMTCTASKEEVTMFKRVLFGGLFVLSATAAVSATIVAAAGLTERIDGNRMTVLKIDLTSGRFLCTEHRHW